jgi:hypothetical protein
MPTTERWAVEQQTDWKGDRIRVVDVQDVPIFIVPRHMNDNPDWAIENAYLAAQAKAMFEAITACLPDLEHYAATHGPGPDKRLEQLKQVIAEAVPPGAIVQCASCHNHFVDDGESIIWRASNSEVSRHIPYCERCDELVVC